MNDLDRSIIATLAYYGSFSWPLTVMEIWERLIPTSHMGGSSSQPTGGHILERLDRLVAMEMLRHEDGLYMLTGAATGFADRRVEQEKIWAQKWRRMLRRAWWLQAVPFVRGLYASGSLAMGNMSSGSDWDMFVIAQVGHLYTARIGLLVVAWVMGSLRTKRSQRVSDTFCFNHYVTTDSLTIRHQSIYVAHNLALLVPVFDPHHYGARLQQENRWIERFRPVPTSARYVRRSVRPSWFLMLVQRAGEFVLAPLESSLRAWQQRRIARDPATHEPGGRVVADDHELEFHPRSFEAVALARYNAVLEWQGLGEYAESDSGLT